MSISQKSWNTIHNIMLYEWDPMGVSKIPGAEDQYDIYIPSLYFLLKSETSYKEIINYLLNLEVDHMGLSNNVEHTKKIAQLLIDSIQLNSGQQVGKNK